MAAKKYSYWLQSAKYTAIQKFSVLGIGVASFMLLSRVLGPESYGVWGLFITISTICEAIRLTLIKNAYVRFSQQYDISLQGVIQTATFLVSLVVTIVFAIGLSFLAAPLSNWLNAPSLSVMLLWYVPALLAGLIFSHFEIIFSARMDFRANCWMYCVRQGVLLLLIVAVVISGFSPTPIHLSGIYLVSILAGTLTGVYFIKPYLRWDRSNISDWTKRLVGFGKFVFANNLFSMLFRNTDIFLVSKFFGTSISAYYNACLRIGNLVDMPSQVFSDILFPKAASYNTSDKEPIKNLYEKSVGAMLVFSLPVLPFLLLFPEFVLRMLAGEQFVQAAPMLRITACFGFMLPFLKQFGNIMDAIGKPQVGFRLMALAFVVNLAANWVGIKLLGVPGAAWGTGFTYLLIFVISQIILYNRFNIRLKNIFNFMCGYYGELWNMCLSKLFNRTKESAK